MKGYADQMKRMRGSLEERVGMAEGGMTRIGQDERIMKGQRGKGAELLRSGRVDLITKDKRILKSWANAAKKHIGITKNMTEEERLDFEVWVQDLLSDHEKISQKAKRTAKKVELSWNYVWTGLKRGATSAFGMIGKGFGAVASGAMKLLSFMGWIGMLTMAVTMIKEFIANIDKLVESMINWGDTLAEMTKDRFPLLSKGIQKLTDNVEEGSEAWRAFKKQQREIVENNDAMEATNKAFEESMVEVGSIMEGLRHDFEDTGHSVELFIKKMKLFESLSVGADLRTMATKVRTNLDNYLKLVEERASIIGAEGFGEKTATTQLVGLDVMGGGDLQTTWDYTDRAKELNTALERVESSIDKALSRKHLDDYLVNLQSVLDHAATTGIDTSTVNISAAQTALDQLDKEIKDGNISPEFYRLMVMEIISGLETQWEQLDKDVIKPGKAMTSLKQITESYNKELANLKQKSMPQAWGKVHSLFNQIGNELEAIDDKGLAKAAVDDHTIDLLDQMGIKVTENMEVEKLLTAVLERQRVIREYAYGLAEKEHQLKMDALDRVGAGAGSKLGGALGAELKHNESVAKLKDQITMNDNKQVDLAKQKNDLKIGEEEYTKQLNALKLQEKQLKKNLEVQEEAFSLQFKLINSFQMAFENLFTEIVKGEKKIGDVFKDVTRMMLQQMAQMMAQVAAIAAMKAIFGPTLFGVAIGGREGGVFSPPGYRSFASGGIAEGPQSGYLATLHGREAVVPLGNDKSIPVEFTGGSGTGSTNIVVNVDAQGGTQTSGVGPAQARQLGQMVASAVQAEIVDQKRPGGLLSPYGDGDY